MCVRDDRLLNRMPLRVILVFAVCICSLVVHLAAEGLSPAAENPVLEVAERGEHVHPVHEHCDDHFILPLLGCLPAEHATVPLQPPAAVAALAFSISPLLPPPNS
jgi:hypothetical protein